MAAYRKRVAEHESSTDSGVNARLYTDDAHRRSEGGTTGGALGEVQGCLFPSCRCSSDNRAYTKAGDLGV
jgi:hypothetical protein